MSAELPRVGVERGDGLVARFGAAVVVLAATATSTGEDSFTVSLLAVLDAWESEASPAPDALAWQLAGLLSAHQPTPPAFGAAVRLADGYLLLLHGSVRALIAGPAGASELTGTSAVTWVDQVVHDPIASISMTLSESGPVRPDVRSDLRAGLVTGGGLVLTPREAHAGGQPAEKTADAAPVPVPDPEPIAAAPVAAPDVAAPDVAAPDVAAPVPEASVVAAEPAPREPAPREPAPREPAPVEPAPQPSPTPRPDSKATADLPAAAAENAPSGGAARAKASETVTIKAATGILVADDGTRTPLDRRYVFGREPQHDESVARGAASPIVVRDPDNMISRVQVHIEVEAGVVTVRDPGSANGTFVAAPGAKEWVRIGHDATVLPVGWSMRMGRRVFTHVGAGS